MATFRNAMEVFQLLDKSNCRECGEKTCLAFAGAVFRGQRRLEECPRLTPDTLPGEFYDAAENLAGEGIREDYLDKLRRDITAIDLAAAADRIGARFSDGKLILKVLGKDFSIDAAGQFSTDIHINPWVAVPFLNYVLHGKGRPVSGNWLSFRELSDGRERYPLFRQRCEMPLKRTADTYTDLFDDMVHIFSGRQVEKRFRADISVVLHPLPLVPIMVCYWLPEDGLESSLNLFFDETAADNLDIGSVFTLGVGLAQMFARLALRHGAP